MTKGDVQNIRKLNNTIVLLRLYINGIVTRSCSFGGREISFIRELQDSGDNMNVQLLKQCDEPVPLHLLVPHGTVL